MHFDNKYKDELDRILGKRKQQRPTRINFESIDRAARSLLSEAHDQIIDEMRKHNRFRDVGMYQNVNDDYVSVVGEEEVFRRYRILVEEYMIEPHKSKEKEIIGSRDVTPNFDPDGKKILWK